MNYAIVDIETTGGHASANGMTEIAVFVHDGERVVILQQAGIETYQLQQVPLFRILLTIVQKIKL